MKERLTDKQLAVLCFAQEFFKENDMLPTAKAVADHFGAASLNAPWVHMRTLEQKGYLEKNAVGKYRFARSVQA